jgi:5-methylcytosine-specific restriction endonuclease McrA
MQKLRRQPCVYCGEKGGTVDHVIPLARGGAHTAENLVPACQRCNDSKGTHLVEEWRPHANPWE